MWLATGAGFESLQKLAGLHRIQRVPPNETKGRRHSSTISVACVDSSGEAFTLDPADVEISFFRGDGPGGQHRNTSDTDVRAVHTPSGVVVTASGRSQWQNRQKALRELEKRIQTEAKKEDQEALNSERASQTSERSFTWCGWRDEVKNHRTGKKSSMSKALNGRLNPLLK